MNNVIISLIIPVYNVEKYLKKCLESVKIQTFKKFEVIIVDDGSTDGSLEIIKDYCNKNSNFKFVRQENKGPAAARNTGLLISKGMYISFLDSDDYLEPIFLEKLYENAIKSNADIVCCNFNFYNPQKDLKICNPFHSQPGTYSRTESLRKLILDIGIHHFVWNKLYKRNLFFENNIEFEDMYFEDIFISPQLFYYANKIIVTDDVLYNYTSRESSILNTINAIKINDYIKSVGMIRNFLENKNDYKPYNYYLWAYSQKVKIMSYYYILNLHIKTSNFKDFFNNINSAKKSVDYFMSKNFTPKDKNNSLKNPYIVKQPNKKLSSN